MVNECFIVNNTNLGAIFAKKWPKDYQTIRAAAPAFILFYNVAGYEVLPEERVSSHIKNISEITQRLGVAAAKSVGGVSANEVLKTVQKPSEDPYWKLRHKGSCEDMFFLTINDKLEGLTAVMNGLAEKAGYPTSDMGMYVQPMVQGTGVHCEFNFFYDPANKDEVNQIKKLTTSATKGLMAEGAFFSRPYGEMARTIVNRDAATVGVLNKLKKTFDPNGIMNPGKVCF